VILLAQVNIRIDDYLKEEADIVLGELGLNMTTAFNIFIRQTVREGGIPFVITTKTDPFYNPANLKILRQSIKEANEGKLTAHELIAD
jgi:DNA-damage-inducible protein J